MTLADFKAIFFWEYVHRLLGRLIGLAFALPLLFFWWRRAIPAGYGWKLGALLGLGALQGAIGWWMVASGLVDVPEVSHIRLAVHLLTALLIFAGLIWVARDLQALAADPAARPVRITLLGIWALVPAVPAILFGAYVAGLDAGYAFNTWPKMGDDALSGRGGWLQPLCATSSTIRSWSSSSTAGSPSSSPRSRSGLRRRRGGGGFRQEAPLLAGAVIAQLLLGILTLLSGVQIDIAVAHQGMAALLLARDGHRRPPARGGGRHDRDRQRLRVFADADEARADRPHGGRGAARRLRQHPRALPLDLSLAGQGRGGRRGRGDLQDRRRDGAGA